jgi:predicted nucleotidyltransferase
VTSPIQYAGNLKWLVDRTILYVRAGSHSYGTNIATSDEDFKGVCVPPREILHGFLTNFEQAESKTPDSVIYDIRKFFRLAADGNPGLLEMMWTEDEDRLVCTEAGRRIIDARSAFLSKKIKHTFCGYSASQLKRIETHRRWLLHPPTHKPTRAEFGLPERTLLPADQLAAADAIIRKKLAEWETGYLDGVDEAGKIAIKARMAEVLADIHINSVEDQYAPAARSCGLGDNFIAIALKEREYTAKAREYAQYENWKATRNQARAALEAEHSLDTKHASHLIRLTRMCREILETGRVIVRRPDADELRAIRNGAWSYDRIVDFAKSEDVALEDVAKKSALPNAPDRVKLDALCQSIVESML